MKAFNIMEIINTYNLDKKEVAEVLFPSCMFKKQALDRIIKGQAFLNTEQLQALANHAGVMINELFAYSSWRPSYENGSLIFKKGEYEAKLNHNGTFLLVTKGTEVISEEIVPNSMSLTDFIKHINKLCHS